MSPEARAGCGLAVPSDSDDWKRQPSLQGLSPRRPLVLASYDPAADIKYPSDTLRSPSLAARANSNVATPSTSVARGLERLPGPASVSHTRQNSSTPASSLQPPATPVTKFDFASDTQRTPHHRRVPAKAEPSVRLAAASSGTSSSVQPISFPQTLEQIANGHIAASNPLSQSGLRFRVPRLS